MKLYVAKESPVGDFIRFILTGEHDLTLAAIAHGLKEIDPAFSIFVNNAAPNSGDIVYGSEIYGEIEVNRPDDLVFSEDIADLRDQLTDMDEDGVPAVRQTLDTASGMIAFQLSEAGHDHYRQIDPFWDWLFDHYVGLLQIDEEGYYTRSGQLLYVP
jgi:hypothetical protein